jgi:hypothetical protein
MGDAFLAEGEFIEEEVYVGTKVGEFSFSKRQKLSSQLEIEAIFEGDIYREHQVPQEGATAINEGFKAFSQKYGIKSTSEETAKPGKASAVNVDLIEKFTSSLK